jgi:hypothetical protein
MSAFVAQLSVIFHIRNLKFRSRKQKHATDTHSYADCHILPQEENIEEIRIPDGFELYSI